MRFHCLLIQYKVGLVRADHPNTSGPTITSGTPITTATTATTLSSSLSTSRLCSSSPLSGTSHHDISGTWLELTLLSECNGPHQQGTARATNSYTYSSYALFYLLVVVVVVVVSSACSAANIIYSRFPLYARGIADSLQINESFAYFYLPHTKVSALLYVLSLARWASARRLWGGRRVSKVDVSFECAQGCVSLLASLI